MLLRTVICASLLAASTLAFAADASQRVAWADADAVADPCGEGGNRQQVECLSTQIDRLRGELDRAYGAALAKLPEAGDQDRRGDRAQLRLSQTAWSQYEQANCALMGAMEGGSSSWITHFAELCEAHEIQARTAVLRQIGNGTLGDH
jgi:uncharacterized protein YecT (DUF1311 family)